MSAWTCRSFDGKAAVKIVPPRPRIPWWKGLGADSEEKREPVSDIDTAAADSLKVLDPERPIREADIEQVAVTIRDFMSTRLRTIARIDIPASLAREIGRFLVAWAHFEHYVQAVIWSALNLGAE